jgi:hypothetical protein
MDIRPGDSVFVGPWTVLRSDHDGYWILDGGDGRTLGVPVLIAHDDAITVADERVTVENVAAALANPAPSFGRWLQVVCPDCGDANRTARRRCKSIGGMCNGTGWTWMSI